MPQFVLNVQDIGDAGKEYDFRVGGPFLVEALVGSDIHPDPDAGDGRLHVHATRQGRGVLVHGTVETRVLARCARCLADVPIDVDVEITSLLSRDSQSADFADEVELTADDLGRDTFQGTEIVLDDLVREHILLECPMQPLCAEDCAGIQIPEHLRSPSSHQGEASVDPRLAPLKELAKKLAGEEE